MKIAQLLTCCCFYLFFNNIALQSQTCGSSINYDDKEQMRLMNSFEKRINKIIKSSTAKSRNSNTIINIPVVIHILHNGESIGNGANISDNQINSQIRVLNESFRRTGYNSNNTPSEFIDVAADTEIEFYLFDVTRTLTQKTIFNIETQDAQKSTEGGISPWDSQRYLNIWVVPDIVFIQSTLIFPIYGYANFPWNVNTRVDGLVVDYNLFGSNYDDSGELVNSFPLVQNLDKGMTIVHETGHWLGLYHTWGDTGCDGDDFCDDTPLCSGPFVSKSEFGCPIITQCNVDTRMIENYMDYSEHACMNLFTIEQKKRMRATLYSYRKEFLDSELCNNSFQEQKIILDSSLPNDKFGRTIDVYNNTIAIGAEGQDLKGAVYIFNFDGTEWSQGQKLVAPDGSNNDLFGSSLSIDEDKLAVGAIGEGAVYFFERVNSNWVYKQKIKKGGIYFGGSVDISGDFAVIGAKDDNTPAFSRGSAYFFEYNGSLWTQKQKLLASDGTGNDYFGVSVSISVNTIIVGADGNDVNQTNTGAAYIFDYNGVEWIESKRLLQNGRSAYDFFGGSVSISGNLCVVGATGRNQSKGSAIIFEKSNNVWNQRNEIKSPDGALNDLFGGAVDIHGNNIVIGAEGNDEKGLNSGAIYTYDLDNLSLKKITANNGSTEDQFGSSVSIYNNTVVVGAFGDNGKSGSTYIYPIDNNESLDIDLDGICDNFDNCPNHFNPYQLDEDFDNKGDYCDCGSLITEVYNSISNDLIYNSSSYLIAYNHITPNVNVTYSASNSVLLREGFHAEKGSEFLVQIGSCSAGATTAQARTAQTNSETHFQPSKKEISVYPNPTNQSITIEYTIDTPQRASLYLMDFSGRIVQQIDKGILSAETYSDKLDFSSTLPLGLYLVVLETDEGKITEKVLYQR